jgi:transposase
MEMTPLLVLTESELAEIEATLHGTELGARQRERLELVKGAAHGWELSQLCSWSGRSARTVQRWLAAYRRAGIVALADAPRTGRPCRADIDYLAALETAVTTEPRSLEQPFDVWTSARLSAYLAETTQVRISPGWLRVVLHQQGFAYGRVKHSVAHLQDAGEVADCVERLAQVGEKGARRT